MEVFDPLQARLDKTAPSEQFFSAFLQSVSQLT